MGGVCESLSFDPLAHVLLCECHRNYSIFLFFFSVLVYFHSHFFIFHMKPLVNVHGLVYAYVRRMFVFVRTNFLASIICICMCSSVLISFLSSFYVSHLLFTCVRAGVWKSGPAREGGR